AEPTVKEKSPSRTIVVNEVIPDPRGVLPIDVISEVIRQEASLIGVAECYCRKAKHIIGEGCDYPLETCLVFNELAQTLINNNIAREIDYAEALDIIWQCEELGLVHNVDNCREGIQGLCNCCSCCCVVLRAWQLGQTNASGPSRYVVVFDEDKCTLCENCVSRCPTPARAVRDGRLVVDAGTCVGCGLCVTACQQGANRMVLREEQPKIPKDHDSLYSKIGREAIVGMVKRRVFGR
ncbi:MAG: 4Fe-4S binding protein, partial [Chloroflexota bacterium]|nr:4Fe-4S binding protein [Chloroflexota bacterium]